MFILTRNARLKSDDLIRRSHTTLSNEHVIMDWCVLSSNSMVSRTKLLKMSGAIAELTGLWAPYPSNNRPTSVALKPPNNTHPTLHTLHDNLNRRWRVDSHERWQTSNEILCSIILSASTGRRKLELANKGRKWTVHAKVVPPLEKLLKWTCCESCYNYYFLLVCSMLSNHLQITKPPDCCKRETSILKIWDRYVCITLEKHHQ